ncbi:hypothetical protein PF003_g15332 [Phytophthora fragariae]|nr:hypothetical protein PF003_g15332 [Phytophthora fragariae]
METKTKLPANLHPTILRLFDRMIGSGLLQFLLTQWLLESPSRM